MVAGCDAEPRRAERGGREVRDVEVRMAAGGERHRGDVAEVVLDARVEQHEPAIAHAGGGAAAPAVRGEQRGVRVQREPAERLAAPARGARAAASSAFTTSRPFGVERARDRELHVRQRLEVVHAVLAEVVGGDAGDHGDVGARDREPAAQDAAARGLEHRRLDARIAQHAARAGRPGIVAGAECVAVRRTRRRCSSSPS